MSDRKRDGKPSKSSYMRAAKKQRIAEERYINFEERDTKKSNDRDRKYKKKSRDYDDYE